MLSFLSSDFIIPLFVSNIILIVSFILVHQNYSWLKRSLERAGLSGKKLSTEQIKILKRRFPFYNKLSPNLKRYFEDRVIHFLYSKNFEGGDGFVIRERMKLLVAAYGAQVSFGLKDFVFPTFNNFIIYPAEFRSLDGQLVKWELRGADVCFSWKDFYNEIWQENKASLGLVLMASLVHREHGKVLKEKIFDKAFLDFLRSLAGSKREMLINVQDFNNKDQFLETCLKCYFTRPFDLKNVYPFLFRRIDHVLYNQIVKKSS